jgi:hypothetical protein
MEMEADFSRDEVEARHIWEGELRSLGDLYACPSPLVDAAMGNQLPLDPGAEVVVGADIAHQGGDRIVFYKRRGLKVVDQYESRYQSVPVTHQHLKAFIGMRDEEKRTHVNVDNGGIGAATADLLEADGYANVYRVNFGGTARDSEHYYDVVTEMYLEFRDVLGEADLPRDEELQRQLTQRKYAYVTGRRGYEVVKLESKEEFLEHSMTAYRSPDKADALVLCYRTPMPVILEAF